VNHRQKASNLAVEGSTQVNKSQTSAISITGFAVSAEENIERRTPNTERSAAMPAGR